jgi:hypothetical protein
VAVVVVGNGRAYLETCVATLKAKFTTSMNMHKQDKRRIM